MRSKHFFAFVLVLSALASVPASAQQKKTYIVELEDLPEPAANAKQAQAAYETPAAKRAAALRHREAVKARHDAMRPSIEATGATVTGSVSLVGNAMFVTTDEAGAARLAQTQGIKRVRPARHFKPLLNRAVSVHKVDQVWSQVGLENAGAGIKIGIIDSGVDSNHPGMQDASMTPPDGFPKAGSSTDLRYTNNKVIVARSYVNLLSARDPDTSARDRVGHGTALAMIAAGATDTGPLGPITGVAPKAYIGSYKIFGTPFYNDSASEAAILTAIEDAVTDGMDVLNMSFGSDLTVALADDLEVTAIEKAASLGVIVVAAAGNDGSDPSTISSPAIAPSAIAAGASRNDRTFASSVTVAGNSVVALRGSGAAPSAPIAASMIDSAVADPTELLCSAVPSTSFSGKVVLILRGVCTFETKLLYAARGGATAAVIYTDATRDVVNMDVGTATLPAQMISYVDGTAIKDMLSQSGTLDATLDFSIHAVSWNPAILTTFSSAGPSVDTSIKPDVTAVGQDVYTATQSFDINGDMYDSSGYIIVDGTSFATPLTAGVAALIKSQRPGLTVAQYRSLIINNAADFPNTGLMQSGSGMVDALAAYSSTLAAYPASLGLGGGSNTPNLTSTITLSNLTGNDDTFSISVDARKGSLMPSVPASAISIGGSGTASISVGFNANGLEAGSHEGFLIVQGAASGTRIRIPYWYAAKSDTPQGITWLYSNSAPRSNRLDQEAVIFRVTDAAGLPIRNVLPKVTVLQGNATVTGVNWVDNDVAGSFGVDLRYGILSAANSVILEIKAGNITKQVSVP